MNFIYKPLRPNQSSVVISHLCKNVGSIVLLTSRQFWKAVHLNGDIRLSGINSYLTWLRTTVTLACSLGRRSESKSFFSVERMLIMSCFNMSSVGLMRDSSCMNLRSPHRLSVSEHISNWQLLQQSISACVGKRIILQKENTAFRRA